MIQRAQASPFYQQAVQTGEEAVLRGAAATGGLRSGTASENLATVNQNALLNAYNQQLQGLQGFAQLPSNANQIAGGMAGIGQTMGQGITAQGQAQQAGMGMLMDAGTKLGAAYMMSDPRLKTNIKLTGKKNGHDGHSWTWNKAAEALGLLGESVGVMADKIAKTNPEAIGERDGYMTVNYKMLGVS